MNLTGLYFFLLFDRMFLQKLLNLGRLANFDRIRHQGLDAIG